MDRSTKRAFNFVNLNHPDDLKNEETQLRIRRLAMAEVGKARREPKTKRNKIAFELRDPSERDLDLDRFGAGVFDPFGQYPVELDDSSQALLANIFSHNTNHSTQLRGSWWPVALSCAAAFHNTLANSQNFLFQHMDGYFPSQDRALALSHHHKALEHAGEMVKSPALHTSDVIIATIISFLAHQALLGSFSGGEWQSHRDALLKVVELRGGFDTIDNECLRITVSWCDLLGSFAQDIPSIVPLPHKWEVDSRTPPNSPRPHFPISLQWKQQFPMRLDWISIFDDIVHLISLDRAFNEQQLFLAITSGSWMEPILVRLLAVRPLYHGNNREHVMEEVCRLGALLFLAPFWRILGQSPVRTAAISRNLQSLLLGHVVAWGELKPLLTWVLYFAAVETNDLAERSQFVSMLAVLAMNLGLSAWGEVLQMVKSVLWVETIFAGSDELIRDEVMQILHQGQNNPPLSYVP